MAVKLAITAGAGNVLNEYKATRLDPDYSSCTYRQILSRQAQRSVSVGRATFRNVPPLLPTTSLDVGGKVRTNSHKKARISAGLV